MNILVFLVLLGIGPHGAAAVPHSLKYFYTASSQVPNFPEFVVVGLVDDIQMVHYDSNTRRAVPKQDWMIRVTEDDTQYLKRNTGYFVGSQQAYKVRIDILKQRFNQTGGVHIFQLMYGCEWDDQTGEVKGFWQYGYDGEDFISFDLETGTYIAPKRESVITKHKWDSNKAWIAQNKHYLTQICPEWLKKYVNYGGALLLRTDLPSVSLLQKSPSSPVTCHATGFYPDRAMMFWRKDGEELHDNVDHREMLPNHDGSFQISVDLNISSVPAVDWKRYQCVFQLSGVEEDIVKVLDPKEIRTNNGDLSYIYIIVAVAVLALALALIAVIGFVVYKNKKVKCPPSPDNSSELSEKLNPDPK